MTVRRFAAAALLVAMLPLLADAQTALRPDQIQPGTPDITTGVVGNFLQIGTVIPWRQDTTATPSICTASGVPAGCPASDNAKNVELTFNGPITATLPDATGANNFGDGTGFTIQVGPGILTLNRASASTISGAPTILVGPWQAVSLLSRTGNWYATVSQRPVLATIPIVFVGATDLTNNNNSGLTLSHSVNIQNFNANEMLVVAICGDNVSGGFDDITGVTYAGAPMLLAAKFTPPAGMRYMYLYYKMQPASGPNNVVITSQGPTAHWLLGVAAEYSGVSSASPVDLSANNYLASGPGTLTTPIVTTADKDWVLMVYMDSAAATAGTNSIVRLGTVTYLNPTLLDSGGPATPAGSFSMSVSNTGCVSSPCAISVLMVAFKHGP